MVFDSRFERVAVIIVIDNANVYVFFYIVFYVFRIGYYIFYVFKSLPFEDDVVPFEFVF